MQADSRQSRVNGKELGYGKNIADRASADIDGKSFAGELVPAADDCDFSLSSLLYVVVTLLPS